MTRREGLLDVQSLGSQLREEGWAVTPPVVPPSTLDELAGELTPLLAADSERGGLRHLLDLPSVQALARSAPVRAVAESVLGPHCFAVRGILFDKTPNANWKVIWHQDLTIAVKQRRDVPGFGPWSEKDGVPHVQPPAALLERMLAVRVHLDDCGPENGPVRVIPRSHRSGRLSGNEVDAWKRSGEAVDCTVPRGGILAFHPLTLHASSPAAKPAHRRVVHLEYAADSLPDGLMWYQRV
jgi:ectoine hydroxylase-related dioxygenase (phytanoyl-CoA dioxygenase family)